MKIKSIIITCLVVVLYLSLCSWRVQRLEKIEENNEEQLVINVN